MNTPIVTDPAHADKITETEPINVDYVEGDDQATPTAKKVRLSSTAKQETKTRGGWQKVLEKRKKGLAAAAVNTKTIQHLFSLSGTSKSKSNDSQVRDAKNDTDDTSETRLSDSKQGKEQPEVAGGDNEHEIDPVENDDRSVVPVGTMKSAIKDDSGDILRFLPSKSFDIPSNKNMDAFFAAHPCQPKMLKNHKGQNFDTHSLFYRTDDEVNRIWLSYNNESNSLHCKVCLAFSPLDNKSPFVKPGVADWNRANLKTRIETHETSTTHRVAVDAFFTQDKSKDVVSLLFRGQKSKHNAKVTFNRKILERVIDILKLIGKMGLSYRGKRNENSGSLLNGTVDHGNFLEIFLLLAKYDPICGQHLDNITKVAPKTQGRGGHVTMISKTTLNLALDMMLKLMKGRIANEVKTARMVAIEIDTTQDVTVDDQCSIVLRYVTDKVYERIIGMKKCTSTTGQAMFDLVSTVLKDAGLDITDIVGTSTDGASNMQGQYNGFNAHVTEASPLQVFVWCFAHVLNLVMQDGTKSVDATNLFSLLNMTAAFLRDSHNRMDEWRNQCPDDRRLCLIGATRWWAKDNALTKVFGLYGDSTNALFPEVIRTLSVLEEKCSGEARLKASTYKEKFESYRLISTAIVFSRIFAITTPLSKYLQTSGLDLLKAQSMVTRTLEQLQAISRGYDDVKVKADSFVSYANDDLKADELDQVEDTFKETRSRKRKRLAGETAEDTTFSAENEFRIKVHNQDLDTVTQSLDTRFTKHGMLFSELACLDPKNFDEVASLPNKHFESLSKRVIRFNLHATPGNIRSELIDFAGKWKSIKSTISDTYKMPTPPPELRVADESDGGMCPAEILKFVEDDDTRNSVHMKSCRDCPICCYFFLMRYNLYSKAISTVYTCYKYLLTLPVSSVACERSFSKLAYIKNKLRNSLSQDRLEVFAIMALEFDILNTISVDEIIDCMSKHSTLLGRLLTYM